MESALPTSAPPPLLSRRTIYVVGKGGVGKTTVAWALTRIAVERGMRVLHVRLGVAPDAQRGDNPEADDAPLISLGRGAVIDVEGEHALGEYLGLKLPRALHALVVRSRVYREFVRIAPGLKELMAIGKVAHEERRVGDDGVRLAWDLIVVDCPASGHSVQYLRMPAAAARAFGVGLVRWEADRVLGAMHDPARIAVCLVTTPEELPVGETIETAAQLRASGLPLGPIFVNRIREAPVAPEAVPSPSEQTSPLAMEALRCGREQATRAAAHRREINRLAGALAGPYVHLPQLPSGRVDAEGLAVLASRTISSGIGDGAEPRR